MNKIEEYREKLLEKEFEFGFRNHSYSDEEVEQYRDNLKANYRTGFDACLALDLPVKFARWYCLECKPMDEKLAYKYWIDNIRTP